VIECDPLPVGAEALSDGGQFDRHLGPVAEPEGAQRAQQVQVGRHGGAGRHGVVGLFAQMVDRDGEAGRGETIDHLEYIAGGVAGDEPVDHSAGGGKPRQKPPGEWAARGREQDRTTHDVRLVPHIMKAYGHPARAMARVLIHVYENEDCGPPADR
jgi:hypothetical protein